MHTHMHIHALPHSFSLASLQLHTYPMSFFSGLPGLIQIYMYPTLIFPGLPALIHMHLIPSFMSLSALPHMHTCIIFPLLELMPHQKPLPPIHCNLSSQGLPHPIAARIPYFLSFLLTYLCILSYDDNQNYLDCFHQAKW